MADIFDYLDWRCDIPFDADPFNDVDNLILAELAYSPLEGAVPADGRRTPLSKVCEAYFSIRSREEAEKSDDFMVRAALLMDGMLEGPRFSRTEISDYVNIVDTEEDLQMSAVTYILSDGTAYVAFRGTDNTVVGWKEDFNMSWLPETGGQREAVDYLNRIGKKLRRPLRVGGHSKGGNFAVYASAFCDRSVQDRITDVYTNDGPGFRTEVMESEGYRRIISRVRSIVPEDSVIGMLLSSSAEQMVISSSGKRLLQHDGLTWQVERNHFVPAERSDFAKFIAETQADWLSKIDDKSREAFVNALFALLEATGADTFGEMSEKKLRSFERMLSGIQDMPRETQQMLLRISGEFFQSGSQIMRKAFAQMRAEAEKNRDRGSEQ